MVSRNGAIFKKKRKNTTNRCFVLYVLESSDERRTYVGVTKDLHHRLRQHNRELKGGAKATAGKTWRIAAVIQGFPSDHDALSLEKSIHNKGKALRRSVKSPLERRIACIKLLMKSKGLDHLRFVPFNE